MTDIVLGLIGDNIAASQAPRLHRLAGELAGADVRYDRLIPRELGKDFDEVFEGCAASGYRGVNVTYPYKERAAAKVRIDDPLVRAIGAVNTVIFGEGEPNEGGVERDRPSDLSFRSPCHLAPQVRSQTDDLRAKHRRLGAQQRVLRLEVVLRRDVVPGDRWKVCHERVCVVGSEHRFELAMQVESGAVVDRHVVLLDQEMRGEVGTTNGTRGS